MRPPVGLEDALQGHGHSQQHQPRADSCEPPRVKKTCQRESLLVPFLLAPRICEPDRVTSKYVHGRLDPGARPRPPPGQHSPRLEARGQQVGRSGAQPLPRPPRVPPTSSASETGAVIWK